ncbi:UNVERIFIED_CONTAM: hypothetical protein RMT77_005995 [Armadillidium vulgare]
MRFDCPPGTYFKKEESVCVHDSGNKCPTSGPQPPAPFPIFGGNLPETKPPGTIVRPPGESGSPTAPINNFPPAVSEGNTICPVYELDTSGVFDCAEPGLLPSYADCSKFYICINTMGCIVKGFYVSCPKNFIYSAVDQFCVKESEAGPCPLVQDDAAKIKVFPMVTLKPDNYEDFFKASAYWEYMPFLPTVNQRIVPKPSDVARGTSKKKTSLN